MRTNFYNIENKNEILVAGETIEKVFIYGNGKILAELETIEEYEYTTKLSSIYDGSPDKIYIKGGCKRANKLNLTRKDNFIIKNQEARYSFDKPYNFYINVSNVGFENAGEMLSMETKDEKNYLQAYKITFDCVEFTRCKYEKEACENYILKDGERFENMSYGPDKKHACISLYDHSENSFFSKKHPEKAGEKGIVRKWREKETCENYTMLVTKRGYTKCIKSDARKERENIAEKINNILGSRNISFSHYDVERLQEAGVTITFE